MEKLTAFTARGEASIAGTVSVGDGETFDVGQALKEGEGTIVVLAGSRLEYALQGFDALKPTSVPEGAVAVNADEAKSGETTVKASKAAKNKAAKLGVDLSQVEGSGAGGAITVEDVEKAAEASNGGDGS